MKGIQAVFRENGRDARLMKLIFQIFLDAREIVEAVLKGGSLKTKAQWPSQMNLRVAERARRLDLKRSGILGKRARKSLKTNTQDIGRHKSDLRWYRKRIEEYGERQFTTRLKVCVYATEVSDEFLDQLENRVRKFEQLDAFLHLSSSAYLEYIGCMLDVIDLLIACSLKNVMLQALSGICLLTYMLNSLMHPENQKKTDPKNYVKDNRCVKNRLCFLRGAFFASGHDAYFAHSFDLGRMKIAFPAVKIVENNLPGNVRVYPNLEKLPAGTPAEIVEAVNNPNGLLQVYKRVKPQGSMFDLDTTGLVASFGDVFNPNTHPVDLVFRQYQAFRYDVTNPLAVSSAFDAKQIISYHRFGTRAAAWFLVLFWKEYFQILGQDFEGCDIKTLKKGSRSQKIKIDPHDVASDYEPTASVSSRMQFLLPLVGKGKVDTIDSYVRGPDNDPRWRSFGSRAFYLELFASKKIPYPELIYFHANLMVGCAYMLRYVPTATRTHFCRKVDGKILVRKSTAYYVFPTLNGRDDTYTFLWQYVNMPSMRLKSVSTIKQKVSRRSLLSSSGSVSAKVSRPSSSAAPRARAVVSSSASSSVSAVSAVRSTASTSSVSGVVTRHFLSF
ncbi:uncharacterized protein EV154DRAFT_489928 [Mucor mucedo]|uniref:uncharacterized protein n=1 Tax=Mucor mucedo TaxID=29922 RepID=UPI00221E4CAF|nr:uncharacterized protein EV154DRAFT_489928 [Mucor mucedo]KAI7897424.1 hypothetical protein EV154DRAFT_489928 [Mucor mucedo]